MKLSKKPKEICVLLTDEQKEKMKEYKTCGEFIRHASEEGIELPEELLNEVAGGVTPAPHTTTYIDAMTSAEAECQKCHQPFTYWYFWVGGMHDGPWNHPVPELCPKCDPNSKKER